MRWKRMQRRTKGRRKDQRVAGTDWKIKVEQPSSPNPQQPSITHLYLLLLITYLTIPPPTPTILLLCIIVNIVNTVCCNVCVVKFNTIQCK